MSEDLIHKTLLQSFLCHLLSESRGGSARSSAQNSIFPSESLNRSCPSHSSQFPILPSSLPFFAFKFLPACHFIFPFHVPAGNRTTGLPAAVGGSFEFAEGSPMQSSQHFHRLGEVLTILATDIISQFLSGSIRALLLSPDDARGHELVRPSVFLLSSLEPLFNPSLAFFILM